jgi:hypothetical protein
MKGAVRIMCKRPRKQMVDEGQEARRSSPISGGGTPRPAATGADGALRMRSHFSHTCIPTPHAVHAFSLTTVRILQLGRAHLAYPK